MIVLHASRAEVQALTLRERLAIVDTYRQMNK